MTLHSLIELFGVCYHGMLPGSVYNAAHPTSQIGDCVTVVKDYQPSLCVFHYTAISEAKKGETNFSLAFR